MHLQREIPESTTPPCDSTQSTNLSLPAWISFRAFSRSWSGTSNNWSLPFFFASSIPLSSKHSLIAPSLYAGPSICLFESEGAGISPSCEADRFPPGKTWADGKELDVLTRCNRRISLEGDIRRILQKGKSWYEWEGENVTLRSVLVRRQLSSASSRNSCTASAKLGEPWLDFSHSRMLKSLKLDVLRLLICFSLLLGLQGGFLLSLRVNFLFQRMSNVSGMRAAVDWEASGNIFSLDVDLLGVEGVGVSAGPAEVKILTALPRVTLGQHHWHPNCQSCAAAILLGHCDGVQ